MSFHPQVEAILRKAGWYPGRQVDESQVAKWNATRPLFPAAERALREFSGIFIEQGGRSFLEEDPETFANTLHYQSLYIEPMLTWLLEDGNENYDEYIKHWGAVYPLAMVEPSVYNGAIASLAEVPDPWKKAMHCVDAWLINEEGKVFMYHYQHLLVGDTIEEALQNFLMFNNRIRKLD